MILGVDQATAGFSLFAGNADGRVIGIVGAALGALGALLAVGGSYPFWSLGVFALCLWIPRSRDLWRGRESGARARNEYRRSALHDPQRANHLLMLEFGDRADCDDPKPSAGGCSGAGTDGFISPLDLVDVGLVTAEEAEQLHAIETAATAK